MVYQLLSGHLPFWDATSDRSPFAVMSAILNQEARSFNLSLSTLYSSVVALSWKFGLARWQMCSSLDQRTKGIGVGNDTGPACALIGLGLMTSRFELLMLFLPSLCIGAL